MATADNTLTYSSSKYFLLPCHWTQVSIRLCKRQKTEISKQETKWIIRGTADTSEVPVRFLWPRWLVVSCLLQAFWVVTVAPARTVPRVPRTSQEIVTRLTLRVSLQFPYKYDDYSCTFQTTRTRAPFSHRAKPLRKYVLITLENLITFRRWFVKWLYATSIPKCAKRLLILRRTICDACSTLTLLLA